MEAEARGVEAVDEIAASTSPGNNHVIVGVQVLLSAHVRRRLVASEVARKQVQQQFSNTK